MNIIISKSTKPLKKYVATITNDGMIKDIYFGDSRYQSYETHNDDRRKNNYIKRHAKRENWEDPLTSGFWAANLLWNKKTLQESIDDINKRFTHINVTLK